MKIKTVTCHHVYNYGATLQAFALQSYLESQGHEVEILDYRLPGHIRYEWFTWGPPVGRAYPYLRKFPFLRFIYYPYKRRGMRHTWGRKKAFDTFDKQYLHLSADTYRNIDEIRKASPQADVYIAGSDQIWNTDYENGRNLGYYLDFGPKETRRISYAASFGISKIKEGLEDFVKQQLSKFEKLSVREATGVGILHSLGLKGVQVVDPVFLLNMEEWLERLNLKEQQGDYIFLYDFLHDDEKIQHQAKGLSEKTGLKIVSVNDFSNAPYADKQINNAGPREFLQLLLNARYVVCNSFHATAFSLIFHKEFATYPLVSQGNSSRMTDLLKDVGMMERFKPEGLIDSLQPIVWKEIEEKISKMAEESKRFLVINRTEK